MKLFGPRTCATFFVLSFLASCSLNYDHHDPEYDRLLPSADRQPLESDIVGMWHRQEVLPSGHNLHYNILFRGDHTGVTKSTSDDPDPLLGWMETGDNRNDLGAFTWSYGGAGVWTMRNSKGKAEEGRLSQGKLLRTYQFRGPNRWVFQRVK